MKTFLMKAKDILMKVLDVLKSFFKSKKLGFYFTVVAILLSVAQLIIYCVSFSDPAWVSYMDWKVVFFAAFAIALGVGLSVFRITSPIAPAGVALMEFLSFLMFLRYGYMYFSQIFFSGVSVSLFFQMYYGYLISIFMYLITLGLAIAGIFLKQNKSLVKIDAVTLGGELA